MDISKNIISKILLWGIPPSESFQSKASAIDSKVKEASQVIFTQQEDPSLSPVPAKKMDVLEKTAVDHKVIEASQVILEQQEHPSLSPVPAKKMDVFEKINDAASTEMIFDRASDSPPKEAQKKTHTKITDLPPEMLAEVISYLGSEDLQNVATMNKVMQHTVMTEVNHNELPLVRNFIQLLIQGLAAETYSEQRKELEKILQEITPEKIENLEHLEDQLFHIDVQESSLIKVMTTLDAEAFKTLSQMHPPKSMKYVFAVSACERFFQNQRSKLTYEENDMQEFHQTIKNLISIDKNVGVALNLDDKSDILSSMAKRSLKTGNIDRAIDFVNMLPEAPLKAYTLLEMSSDLIQEKKFDLALDVAKMISPELAKEVYGGSYLSYTIDIRNDALLNISCALVLENINKAFEIVEIMPEHIREDFAFQALFEVLVKERKFNQAIEIVEMLPKDKRDLHFVQLCKILVEHSQNYSLETDEMLRIADKISDDKTTNYVYQLIARAINKKNHRKAWQVSEMISDPEKKARTQHILMNT